MGTIKRFNLGRIIKEYNTGCFFETGTWQGNGVSYAIKFPFKKVYSSEIIPAIAQKAKEKFLSKKKVEIFEGNSIDVFLQVLPSLQGNCIFWLDAHFPGAEEGINNYNKFDDETIRLPLKEELSVLKKMRHNFKDVILIDDIRIYEEGPFTSGNLPAHVLPPQIKNLNFLHDLFSDSHHIIKSYQDEGYAMLFPKVKPGSSPALANRIYNLLTRKIY